MTRTLLVAGLIVVVGSGCSSRDASRLSARFPVQAERILAGSGFALGAEGYAPVREPSGAQDDPVKGAEASLAGRRRLQVKLPEDPSTPVVFTVGDFRFEVRERGLAGKARQAGGALVFGGLNGASWWTAHSDGFEEWLEVEATGNGPVAEWEVTGARLRQAGDAVEVLDATGVARVRVTAPEGWDAAGQRVAVRVEVRGGRLALLASGTGPMLLDPSWVTTGSISFARSSHTATLLPNGKVLVAGGHGAAGYLASAELYDPATGSWSTTGSMTVARSNHTATLLTSGKVLVAGGQTNGTGTLILSTSELYDPGAGTWTSTGTMPSGHYLHTATPLPNGKVLLAGGGVSNSAALYDPGTGSWSATGSMVSVRAYHSATLLSNGKVLAAGGYLDPFNVFRTAELYDPATGTWSATGQMAAARYLYTATQLPNGKVLVAGGAMSSGFALGNPNELYDPVQGTWSTTLSSSIRFAHTAALLPDGRVLAVGGKVGVELATADMYDAGPGMWSPAISLAVARMSHTATLLPDGRVLVVGGSGPTGDLASVELHDPNAGTWSPAGSLAVARGSHTGTLLPSGKVLAVGGLGASGSIAGAELFDPVPGVWSSTGSMASARANHSATLLPNGKVLVAGGIGTVVLASAELYDPGPGTWAATGSMTMARANHTATLLPSGKVLVAGGAGAATLASAELYDPQTGTWSATGTMAAARDSHTATLLPSGKVLVAGGASAGVSISGVELFDPGTETWSTTGSLYLERHRHTTTLLANGKVLLAGGTKATKIVSGVQIIFEIYDPLGGTWGLAGNMTTPRTSHTATLLPSGKVLVVGGATPVDLASSELFDPATGTWTATGSMNGARRAFTATLLPGGRLLAAGGEVAGGQSASTELHDLGRPAVAAAVPVLASTPSSATRGSSISISGTGFFGISEASSGNGSSPTSFPLLRIRSERDGQSFALVTSFGQGTLQASVPGTLLPGPSWLSVVVSGVASVEQATLIVSPALTISPSTLTLPPRGSASLTASGGSGAGFGWSLEAGPSGGSLGAATGLYVAGAVGNVTDVARLRDAYGQTTSLPISVTAGISISPSTASILVGGARTFSASGGSGTGYAWLLSANPSGGTIVPTSGFYQPGPVSGVTDVVRVTDSLGNVASANVTVLPALAITPGTVTRPPGGTQSFSVAGGGGAPYTWSLAAAPSGSSIHVSSGAYVAGRTGNVTDVVQVADALGNTATRNVTVTEGVSITPATSTVTARGAITFAATGGSGTGFQWALASAPSGGTIGATSGGYQAGSLGNVTDVIQVTDSLGNVATRSLAVQPGPLSIEPATASAPPRGTVSFSAWGGSGAGYVWSMQASLSGGSITAGGAYTAGTSGSVTDVVKVTDSLGTVATRNVIVTAGLSIQAATTTTPPGGTIALTGSGGSGTGYVWTISTNASGGAVPSGVYTAGRTGGVTDTVQLVDSLGNVATRAIAVTPGISVSPTTVTVDPGGTISFTAMGGSGASYTWSFNQAASGGTITAAGVYTAGERGGVTDVVQVTDSLGNIATRGIAVRGGGAEATENPFKMSCAHGEAGPGSLLLLGLLLFLRPRRRATGGALLALALLLPATGSAAAAPAKKKEIKVVVVPMMAGLGVEAKLAEAMTTVLVAELTGRGIQAITPKDVQTALVIENQKQMLGCANEECLTELAGAMGTELIVSGSLAVVGKVKMTTVQLFNARTGVVEKTFQEHLENAETEDLLDAAERAGESLFPGTKKSGSGPKRRTLLAAAPARPLALELGGFYEPTGPGGMALLLLTWRLDAGVRLSAGALLAGAQHPGAMLRASWAPFQRWRFSPYLAVEGVGVFAKETLFGAGAALGLEWAITDRFSLSAELPAVWLLSAPAEYKTSYLLPGLVLGWAL